LEESEETEVKTVKKLPKKHVAVSEASDEDQA
jgi:hypothetical protein